MSDSIIIDRRLNGKNKSAPNRERFYRRYKPLIKESARNAIKTRKIGDDTGHSVSIPKKSVKEYTFTHASGTGIATIVHPGNDRFARGDKIPKPPAGQGSGNGQGGPSQDDGEAEDDFVFNLSKEEYLAEIFDDLELPNMTMENSDMIEQWHVTPAGFADTGSDSNINYRESFKKKTGRKIAMSGKYRRRLEEIELILEALNSDNPEISKTDNPEDHLTDYYLGDLFHITTHGNNNLSIANLIDALHNEAAGLREKVSRIPSFTTNDLKYNLRIRTPEYSNRAVMICLMDVSGSMGQGEKDLAKRYFILLYMFLKRNYDKIEVVFVRHHTEAREVDEEEFFYSKESGGTIVYKALDYVYNEIIQKRFAGDKNIYFAQASDGDTWGGSGWGSDSGDDAATSAKILRDKLLPAVRHMTYIEVATEPQTLWHKYEALTFKYGDKLNINRIKEPSDCIDALRQSYKRRSR